MFHHLMDAGGYVAFSFLSCFVSAKALYVIVEKAGQPLTRLNTSRYLLHFLRQNGELVEYLSFSTPGRTEVTCSRWVRFLRCGHPSEPRSFSVPLE